MKINHIDVHYHFIKDHVEKKDIKLFYVGTDYQIADIFIRPLPASRFVELRFKLGMMRWSEE